MSYFISRQIYWGVEPDEAYTVEIATGGSDYSNPDMLVEAYAELGEGEEYDDPRDAVDAAIKIAEAWQRDEPNEVINVASGYTGGNTMPFEASTAEELRAWAEKEYESLDKCPSCGDIIPDGAEKYTAGEQMSDGGFLSDETYEYCSENCAEKNTYCRCDICDVAVPCDEIDEDDEGDWICDECQKTGRTQENN